MCCKHAVVAPYAGPRVTQRVICLEEVTAELVVEPGGFRFEATVRETRTAIACIEGPGFLIHRVSSVERTAHVSAGAALFF